MPVPVAVDPDKLVQHATELTSHQTAAGRPRSILLRRAVSAAYYATFHALSLAAVERLAPSATAEQQHRLRRSISHGRLAEVCKWITSRKGDAGREHVRPIITALHARPEIRDLAIIVHHLQDARHRADYDHLASFDKAMAKSLVQQSEQALAILRALQSDADLDLFLALVALHTQLS